MCMKEFNGKKVFLTNLHYLNLVNSAYFVKSNLQVLAMFQQLHIAGGILKALLAANFLFFQREQKPIKMMGIVNLRRRNTG